MKSGVRRLIVITCPALIVAILVSMAAIELWVRWRWDPSRGMPGFYVSDPVLGQTLSPGYDGWFAGVRVHINSLGFRDEREYSLAKSPQTFRILVFGDSVTFGHGALSHTTYPYLLEQRLKQWRPDVDWQVWNLGVPGYNTTTELKYLERVGPAYQPDLVIIGFYENDLADNDAPMEPTLRRRVTSAVQAAMQRWLYSYELYKRIALTVRWQWFTPVPDRSRIEALAGEEALMARGATETGAPLTEVDKFADAFTFRCPELEHQGNRDRLEDHLRGDDPSLVAWKRSVAELQRLNREGVYRIVFFINMAPNQCPSEDRFVDGGAFEDEAALRTFMDRGTPVVSSTRAFMPYRPSQMPGASGHSTGNANRVKADALFDALTSGILPQTGERR